MTFRLRGLSYFPGYAQGRLLKGATDNASAAIVLLTQHDLPFHGATPRGIILVDVAPFSHPVLRLRTLDVPIVLIESADVPQIPCDEELFLDGASGLITTSITARSVPPSAAAVTSDGIQVELSASIGSVAGAYSAVKSGAASIGLLRSEYLFPSSGKQPDVAFLQSALSAVCEAARPLPLTVRLLDIASDKRLPWLGELPGVVTVLGLQGARLYEFEPVHAVLRAQLAALAQLAGEYRLSVLIPYLTQLEELERWHGEILAGISPPIPVGAMLETPAAALAIAQWMQVADFVALGCNDLMQCLFAADRDQPALSHLLDPYSPTLYRFLRQIAHDAGAGSSRILVCGLLSQLTGVLPILIGMGYRRFSVDPAMIPWLAAALKTETLAAAGARAEAACIARYSAEVKEMLGLPR